MLRRTIQHPARPLGRQRAVVEDGLSIYNDVPEVGGILVRVRKIGLVLYDRRIEDNDLVTQPLPFRNETRITTTNVADN